MWTVEEAWRAISAHPLSLSTVEVPLADAHGHLLAEDLRADRDFPPFDRAAMDGIALRHADWQRGCRSFSVVGCQAAGAPRSTLPETADCCFEVMTGAVLPQGCDTIVPVEQITREDDRATLSKAGDLVAGRHVHFQGSDRLQGDPLLAAGRMLRSPEIAVAATVGKPVIRVTRLPRILIISTGDELVPVDGLPLPHQIRQSNGPALLAALRRAGFQNTQHEHLRDDLKVLDSALADAVQQNDLLILSGGVSMGKFDLVPGVLTNLGVSCVFHKVSQRPGKPLWYGRKDPQCTVFGLPGNPVSAVVCLHRYVLPWLLQGSHLGNAEPERIALRWAVPFKPHLSWFLPVRIDQDEQGERSAVPCPTAGSGDLAGLCNSDGFLELALGPDEYPAGYRGHFYPWY